MMHKCQIKTYGQFGIYGLLSTLCYQIIAMLRLLHDCIVNGILRLFDSAEYMLRLIRTLFLQQFDFLLNQWIKHSQISTTVM